MNIIMVTMPHWLLLLLAASFSSLDARIFSSALGCISPPRSVLGFVRHGPMTSSKVTSLPSTEDNQAEIAALEEKLRQLRDREINPQNDSVKGIGSISLDLSFDGQDAITAESSDSIMFSERWKVTDENNLKKQEEGKGTNIALALVIVVLTGIFSQVPIGSESLQKYQAVQGNPSRIDLGDLNPVR